MSRAKAIVRYGIGVDNVDLAAAKARGIPVCNVPDYCIDEVADHTLAFMLALTRHVVPTCNHLRAGQWSLPVPLQTMHALKTLTVGIVGFGRIGREVASRLQAFKSKVVVFDPVVPAAEVERADCVPTALNDVLHNADVLTLHCPSTPATMRMIDRAALAKMKPALLFINVVAAIWSIRPL